jgi:hypothetical protein
VAVRELGAPVAIASRNDGSSCRPDREVGVEDHQDVVLRRSKPSRTASPLPLPVLLEVDDLALRVQLDLAPDLLARAVGG